MTPERPGLITTLTGQVAQDSMHAPAGSVAVARGRRGATVAAWDRRLGTGFTGSVVIRRQRADGGWAPAQALAPDGPGRGARGVQLAADASGRVYAAWIEGSQYAEDPTLPGLSVRVRLAELAPGGTRWSTPQEISSPFQIDPFRDEPVGITANRRGDLAITWTEDCGRGCRAMIVRRPAGGAVGPAEPLNEEGESVNDSPVHLALANDGTILSAWTALGPGVATRVRTRSGALTGPLAPARTLASGRVPEAGASAAGVASDGTTCAVGWVGPGEPSGGELTVTRWACAAGTPGAPDALTRTLIPSGGAAQAMAMAMSPRGRPAVVWWQGQGTSAAALRLATAGGTTDAWRRSRVGATAQTPRSTGSAADAVTLTATAGALVATWKECRSPRSSCHVVRGTTPRSPVRLLEHHPIARMAAS